MPKSRPIEDNRAVGRGRLINDAADQHVFDHRAIAMQEHDGRAVALFHVVQPDAVHCHEPALGQVVALGLGRAAVDQHRRSGESEGGDAEKAAGAGGRTRSPECCPVGHLQAPLVRCHTKPRRFRDGRPPAGETCAWLNAQAETANPGPGSRPSFPRARLGATFRLQSGS